MEEKAEILKEGGQQIVGGAKNVARVGTWAVTSAALAIQEKTNMM